MTPIAAATYDIVFNENGYNSLNKLLKDAPYSKLFIIVDNNTHKHCLPSFLSLIETNLEMEIIEILAGEENKTIDTCVQVWEALADLNADRKGLILNVGGGVVTDLGGFIASTFKRGMAFINIPTSLLSMVDASVGGKTGVDLGSLKNLVGVINNPEMVLVDAGFLATLPQNEMRSGLAEMYKHGLIADRKYWESLSDLEKMNSDDLNRLVHESIVIKNTIVLEDPREQSKRKTLNYGHTLGHAIESYCLKSEDRTTLLHGEAIAVGMILETFISTKICGFPSDDLKTVTAVLLNMYDKVSFNDSEINQIIELLKYDKKNSNGNINFVLLENIGNPVIDKQVSNDLIREAFNFYADYNF